MQELTFEQVEVVSGGGVFLPFVAGLLASYVFDALGGSETVKNAFNNAVDMQMEGLERDIANGTAYD